MGSRATDMMKLCHKTMGIAIRENMCYGFIMDEDFWNQCFYNNSQGEYFPNWRELWNWKIRERKQDGKTDK